MKIIRTDKATHNGTQMAFFWYFYQPSESSLLHSWLYDTMFRIRSFESSKRDQKTLTRSYFRKVYPTIGFCSYCFSFKNAFFVCTCFISMQIFGILVLHVPFLSQTKRYLNFFIICSVDSWYFVVEKMES